MKSLVYKIGLNPVNEPLDLEFANKTLFTLEEDKNDNATCSEKTSLFKIINRST